MDLELIYLVTLKSSTLSLFNDNGEKVTSCEDRFFINDLPNLWRWTNDILELRHVWHRNVFSRSFLTVLNLISWSRKSSLTWDDHLFKDSSPTNPRKKNVNWLGFQTIMELYSRSHFMHYDFEFFILEEKFCHWFMKIISSFTVSLQFDNMNVEIRK